MQERPKLKIMLTTADMIFEFVGWILIVLVWGLTIKNYSYLPDTIPTHYNAVGQADGFGGKVNIFLVPLVATVLFIGLTIINKFPHVFNYPTSITKDNALKQYTSATRLVRYLKCILVFIFGLITYQTIRHADGQTYGLGSWFLPMILGLIFIPLIYFIFRSVKTK